jgi:hypothetical protein
MFERFAKALKVAVRDEGFVPILGTGVLLVIVGTLTYTTSQDWSLVDGFYFAVAMLTTSSIADPKLVISGGPIKIFTVFYILVGIGILVELVRQLGFAYVEVRRAEQAARPPRQTTQPQRRRAAESAKAFGDKGNSVVGRRTLACPSVQECSPEIAL